MLMNVNERTPVFIGLFIGSGLGGAPIRTGKRWAARSTHTSRCLARVDPNQRWHGGTVFSARGGWRGLGGVGGSRPNSTSTV